MNCPPNFVNGQPHEAHSRHLPMEHVREDGGKGESHMALSSGHSSAEVQVTALCVPSQKLPAPRLDANKQANAFLIH